MTMLLQLALIFVLGSLSSLSFSQSAVGVLYSDMSLKLAMSDSGLIKEIHVDSGSVVTKGTTLISLDSTMQDLTMQRNKLIWQDTKEHESLVARRTIMRSKYSVAQSLYKESRSISLDELDGLRLELIDLEGRIAQLLEQEKREEIEYNLSQQVRDNRTLRAPISGIVTQIAQREGEWAQVGEPIIGLVDVAELFVKLNVSDLIARQLSVGTALPVNVQNLEPRVGVIDYIAPIADAASGLVELKVKIKNTDKVMRPGVKVTVELLSNG